MKTISTVLICDPVQDPILAERLRQSGVPGVRNRKGTKVLRQYIQDPCGREDSPYAMRSSVAVQMHSLQRSMIPVWTWIAIV